MREIDLYSEMKKYHVGYDEEGNSRFEVPLDPDGLLGRECPTDECSPRYFKVNLERDKEQEGSSDRELTCPYCGTKDSLQEFHTQEQIAWVTDMMVRDIKQSVARSLREAFRPLNRIRGGLLNIQAKVTTSYLPPLQKYLEEELKHVTTCDQCGLEYAVYGISYHCPLCGQGSLGTHLRESVQVVRLLAAEAEHIGAKYGKAAEEQMLGNGANNVVSVFEGFLKHIYWYAVRRKFPSPEAAILEGKIRANFQRLNGAKEFFRRDLGIELYDGVEANKQEQLEILFCKRHVLTHNLGLVDKKYREQAQAWQREGEEVPLDAEEIEECVILVEQVASRAANLVGV